jgi:excinuclease ABC subunit C
MYLSTKANMMARFKGLQDALSLTQIPKRIECFDISHSLGEATVGSCVVFEHAGPVKEDYRRYNIRGMTAGNDLAAMRETLQRRYKHLTAMDEKRPDLIIIDGGSQQLAVACDVLAELNISTIQVISISKGIGRRAGFEMIHEVGKKAYRLPTHSLGLHLIQHIRDEAHRFAITGHRKRRDKVRVQSILESIPGIGAKRRRDLLRYFGGIQGIAHASLERLTEVPGIDLVLAERIFTALHDATL